MGHEWTIVVPVFNELQSLEVILEEIRKAQEVSGRFLVVDNGSTDPRVGELLGEAGKIGVESVRSERNLGPGGGVKLGISLASTDWIGWMPGNLKVFPADVLELTKNVDLDGADFIKARRVNRPLVDQLKTLAVGLAQSLVARQNMLDSGGTPTLIRERFAHFLFPGPDDYLFESYSLYVAQRLKLRISRPKVIYRERRFGVSKWQTSTQAEVELFRRMLKAPRGWPGLVSSAKA